LIIAVTNTTEAVTNTTEAVVKLKPEKKNSGLNGIRTQVSQRSWARIPFRPEIFSGFNFTTA